jgi:hypothetical protein
MRFPKRLRTALVIALAIVTIEVVAVIYLATLEPAPTLEESP